MLRVGLGQVTLMNRNALQVFFARFTSCFIGPDQAETHRAGRCVADLATKRHVDTFALYIAPDRD
jgi:hypothetical protein